MEKYMSTCRVILVTNSTSKVIPAIRSRCLAVRVAAPSLEEVSSVITAVAKKEGCVLPQQLAARIAERSRRNLRRAILMVEACKVAQYPFTADQEIQELDWEMYVKETAAQIVAEQSPRKLSEVRSRLYELIVHCIPPEAIFVSLQKELAKTCDGELKTELCQIAVYYLEAFVAKFMAIYMKFVEETFGGF